MRKEFLAMAVFAGMLAFTSCSNDDNLVTTGNETSEELKAGEGILEIGISNTGIGSRDARPVGSSAAANNVDKVKLVAYSSDDNGVTWKADASVKWKDGEAEKELVLDWNAGPSGEGESTTNRFGKQSIKLTNLTANTSYKFVAYGYNGETDPYSSTETTVSEFVTQTTLNDYAIEELFAGETTTIETDDNSKFTTTSNSVTLTREVAGILAYFQNVPSHINGEKVETIKVCANRKSTGFTFPSAADNFFNGSNTQAEEDVLITFTMATIATNYEVVGVTDTYTFADLSETGAKENVTASQNCPIADDYKAPAGLKLVQNSIFGGRYIMPYDKHYDEQTLTVKMYGTNTTTPLRTLKVKTNQSMTDTATQYTYDIRRNNFYSIGQKLYTGNTGGNPDPDKPDTPNPDTPVDLNKNTDITVIINDAWNVLHNMDVED